MERKEREWEREWERERKERERNFIFHLLARSPSVYSSWDWVRLEPGTTGCSSM